MPEDYYLLAEDRDWSARANIAQPPLPGDIVNVRKDNVCTQVRVLFRVFTGGLLPTIIVEIVKDPKVYA